MAMEMETQMAMKTIKGNDEVHEPIPLQFESHVGGNVRMCCCRCFVCTDYRCVFLKLANATVWNIFLCLLLFLSFVRGYCR